ncbi:MAG: efflux RND transporter periplasmic adaptor subunit [Hyphomicrobiaceae bacterium]
MKKDKKASSGVPSVVWAILIALGIGGWLLSGPMGPWASEKQTASLGKDATGSDSTADRTGRNAEKTPALFEVSTRILKAEPRAAKLVIRGQTKAEARVQVRAETAGIVEAVSSKKGQLVQEGALLCKIDIGARHATLLEAKALRTQAEADHKASSALVRKGHVGALRNVADKAKLDAAKAAYERAQIDLENIEVRAPFRGIIEDQPAKTGDYLRQADVCATLVRMDPVLLTGAVSERDVAKLKVGVTVSGELVTGRTVTGKITFVSPSSDATTKTFMIEAEVPNAEHLIRAGVTADIVIPLKSTSAHRVAASILSLNDAGEVGLRIVDANNTVRFQPVRILSNEKDAVWVAGLPPEPQVITIGQEYVSEGQKVRAKLETSALIMNASEAPAHKAAIQ